MTYRVLDLFCGGGGASEGYRRAGFEVTGVDINPQPHYPFRFLQGDAMVMLDIMAIYGGDIAGIWWDAIHASPPCQAYSVMSKCRPGLADEYPKLIEPVRERLEQIGLPYVIENVEGAPLESPVKLCGTMFGLGARFNDYDYVLRRHRLFEASFPVEQPACEHNGRYALSVAGHGNPNNNDRFERKARRSMAVYGHSAPGNRPDLRGPGYAQATREAMGIDWMNREELAESIPPAYTEHVGKALLQHLKSTSNREAA